MEEWKEIEEFDGKYSVSNSGQIKNTKRGTILKQVLNPTGYYMINVKPFGRQRKSKTFRVHREVAKAFIPNPDNLPQVNHIDGCKTNNHVSNLEWCTPSENARHAAELGLSIPIKGMDNVHAKLTDDIVRYIRNVYVPFCRTYGTRALARQFGVTHGIITKIIQNKKWKHVT